jgi:hypothetical protein
VEFNLEKPIKNAKLRYITTGHGGWENGDEFVPKKNSIFLNNSLVHAFYPWRQDCGAFRNSNPASGNFGNGLSSSDYSRSNWCPGTATNPVLPSYAGSYSNQTNYRYPSDDLLSTGFGLMPFGWEATTYGNYGGNASDQNGVYIFNGEYTPGDTFVYNSKTYMIWPMYSGNSNRVGFAVPME